MLVPGAFHDKIAGRPADERTARPVDGDTWLALLPRLVDEHMARWELAVDGAPRFGENALVLPVVVGGTLEGRAVLKLGWPHVEADQEHLALRLWDGEGSVRLLAANPAADVLLLERLDADHPLSSVSVLESCESIGELFRRLDREGSPQFQTVAHRAHRWRRQLSAVGRTVSPRLVEQALGTLDGLLASAPEGRLVHEDLHDANALAPLDPTRGEWLAIDPKPIVGEWAYAVAPVVWNRAEEAANAHNFRAHVRLRADVVADAAGLDLDRVYAWTFVRLVLNAVWAAEYLPSSGDFLGRMIALAKAFADPPDW
ncbi:streptomycin 6-kinase [Tessaracoccus terricola]